MTTSILDNTINQLSRVSFPNTEVTENSCSICLNDYSDGSILLKMPCNHHFHTNCASTWLHINTTCPICRYNLNADNVSSELGGEVIAETHSNLSDNDLNPSVNYIINTLINHINTEFTNEITVLNNNNNDINNNDINNSLVESLINISTRLQNSLVNNDNVITHALSNLIAATAPPQHYI